MKRHHPESVLQRMCVRYFRLQYPQYAKLLFAIPNGGRRSAIEAAIMQGEGVIPGVPDLFFAKPGGPHNSNGMFIEMKAGAGSSRVSKPQLEMHERLTKSGYAVHVCNSFDLFASIIENYLRPDGK